MEDYIYKELNQEEITPFNLKLLTHCRQLTNWSRKQMSVYYPKWDNYNDVYRGVKFSDVQDRKARDRSEPEKMVVPMTYSQIQTFIAFCFAMYYQRDRVYEISGMSREDHVPAKVGEALMNRDLEYNAFDARLYQFLLDVGRFGLGILKTGWVKEVQQVPATVAVDPLSFLGVTIRRGSTKDVVQVQTKYQGNKILNVSPYRFFPDVRLPISRFQEGEFCSSEDEYPITELNRMEHEGLVAGTQFIKPLTTKVLEDRGVSRLTFTQVIDKQMGYIPISSTNSTGIVILTECQVKIIPSKFEVDGKPLGKETYPVKYNVWYVNDQRVIKCEPLGYLHGDFTYDVAEFSPDFHNIVNAGLSETIDSLQSVISWLINSHITSVRKTIQNWLIVDPSGIKMEDLQDRRPVIRLNPNAARSGVDRWVKQLTVQDVTQHHMDDADQLQKVVQLVTGINDNALGQFYQGRRSATEARNVNASAASRLKLVAQLIWKTSLLPMGRKMLMNLRDGLDDDTFVKVVGDTTNPADMQEFKKVNKRDLIGNYDFKVFDGTMPSERAQQAQGLQELLVALLQEPQIIPILGFDPQLLAREILELRNIRNPERFMLSPEAVQQLVMKIQTLENAPEAGQQPRAGGQPTANGNGAPGMGQPQRAGAVAVPKTTDFQSLLQPTRMVTP